MNPALCPSCHALLVERTNPEAHSVVFECVRCGKTLMQHTNDWLPADSDVTSLFDEVAAALTETGLSIVDASNIARDYYVQFTDAAYCERLGLPVQDDDFFFHESARGVARRAWYYLVLKGNPDPGEFIKWRSDQSSARAEA
jgi:hypothetical protein